MTRRSAWWGGVSVAAAFAALRGAASLGDRSGWGWLALWLALIALTVLWAVEAYRTFRRAGRADERDGQFVKLTNGAGGAVWIRHDTEPVTVSWGGQSYVVTERSVAMNLRNHPAGGGGSGAHGTWADLKARKGVEGSTRRAARAEFDAETRAMFDAIDADQERRRIDAEANCKGSATRIHNCLLYGPGCPTYLAERKGTE